MRRNRRSTLIKVLAVVVSLSLVASGVSASNAPVAKHQTASTATPGAAVPAALDSGVCDDTSGASDPAAAAPAQPAAATRPAYQEIVSPADTTTHTVKFGGASLAISPKAVRLPVGIGITPLDVGQLPKLDSGMTDVTGKVKGGFKFTPHPMTFAADITVTLPYDPALLTDGFTAQDVYTYFYDDVALCWQVLQRVSVDEANHTVTSLTNHFTDMINATVVVPEHPEGTSFNPNQIKGIQAADPGTGVNLIAPPTPNNQGDNRLSYPIEVPAGRAGLQPQLAVSYSSSGGDGWMGLGWDLPTQAIAIDTRWGVPRYSASMETETYMLGGEQLTPVANRGPLQPRSAEKVFHSRTEGSFARIVRHGDGPANYTWEITDKGGTHYFYGGGSTGDPATLADGAGNVFAWALREVRDAHGNSMRYRYAMVEDSGVDGGAEPGRNLYPEKITYTGENGAEGPYAVTFFRDRELGEQLRVDKSIDARGGFKRVTADLLRRIDVTFNGALVRRYGFDYTTGAFFKTLLSSVSQYDQDGRLFNTHRFDYFDDIRDSNGNYQAFQQTSFDTPGDNLSSSALNLTGDHAGDASAVNANTSLGGGGHLYVGVGTASGKSTSVGVKVGFAHSDNTGLLALVDVDGDNLPDKVFKNGGSVSYRKNLSGPDGQLRFDDQLRTLDLPGIMDESSNSLTLGIEGYLSGVAAQLDYVNSFATTSQYFSDVNDDGIADLVDGSRVLFGRIGPDGTPVYGLSGDTPVPVGSGQVDTNGLFSNFDQDRQRLDQSFPLLDSVRRWVAPFDGTVKVEGAVSLAASTAAARAASTTADGVRVAIQDEDTELWADQIGAQDNSAHTPSGVDSITVSRGDRLYFRVQSGADGGLDEVSWDPKVSYLNVADSVDVNGLHSYTYQASDDFILGGRSADVKVPLTGTMHVEGDLHKAGATTDDVTAVITRDGTPVFQQALGAADSGTIPVDIDIPVQQGQILKWRIKVDSPIDASTLSWTPHAFYTAADGVDRITDTTGKPLIVVDPPYDLDIYPEDGLTAPQGFYHVDSDTTLTVDPSLSFNFGTEHPTATVAFTVKRRGGLVAKRFFQVQNGVLTSPGSFTVDARAGDDLFFDFSTLDDQSDPRKVLRLRTFLTGASVDVTPDGGSTVGAPSAFHGTAEEGAFPQPYRGWAVVGYNGNARATLPIVQNDLVIDEHFGDQLPSDVDSHKDSFTANPSVDPPKVTPFRPSPQNNRWEAGEHSWITKNGVSSSRMGVDSVRLPKASDFAGGTAVPRVSRSDQISLTGSVGAGGASIGGSVATGDSTGQVDFFDMNGDGFPDVVGADGVQYTDPDGALGDTHGPMPDGAVRKSDNLSGGVSAGSPARTISTGRGYASSPGHSNSNTSEAGSELPPFSVGGSWGSNTSDGAFDLLDMNGDGLPDRVYSDGRVALNLGYHFGAPESWRGPNALNAGSGSNVGLNIGFNTDFYGFAGGASYAEQNSSTHKTLMDLNGDGLLDRVFDTNPITVSLNTGNGFEPAVPFNGSLNGINADKNTTLGGGVYFTFSICFIAVCIIINPGGNISGGASRSEQMLKDINGDGYADQLQSTKDNQLTVAENRTGRTNLLKSVSRPMGGRMDFDYTRDGNNYDQPQSRWTLSRVAVDDGHPGDGQDVQLTTYEYAGGVYDRLEREFDGYAKVTTRHRDRGNGDAIYRSVTQQFRTDGHYTRGLLTSELTTDAAGHPFLETLNTYTLRDIDHPTATADPRSTAATIFPQLTRTDKRFYEGQAVPGKSTFTTMEYDSFGNMTRSFDAADAGTADDVDTRIQYTASDPDCQAAYIVGAPDVIDVTGGGALMRHRESTVDCANGDITQVRARLATGEVAVTDLTHFDNGNLRSVTDPPNQTGQRYRLDYAYDSTVDQYVTSVTDSFGLQSTSTYNFAFGLEESTTDFNHQTIRNTYDKVGRLDTVVGPYEAPENRLTIDFEYHPEAPVPYAVTRHVDRQADGTVRPDTIDTITFSDGLKRPIQVKADATVFTGADTPAQDVMTVSGRIVYDFLGRTLEQFYPTTEPKGAGNTTFNPVADTVQPTTFSYDVQNRTVRTVLPDNTVSTVSYGFGPDRFGTTQFETVATDADGNSKRTYTDVRQLTTAVKEFNPAGGHPVIWTSYSYDPLGEITAVVDDHNHTTTTEYDNFGRRTVVDSPDSGRTRTVYDLAGNSIQKITAKLAATNQAISYDYAFNRLTAIRYPVFTGNNVTYTYGAPNAPNNGAGRIIAVTDGAGTATREYGPLGEVTKETRTTPAQGSHVQTFTTQYRYDTWNRMLQLTYPDGEVLSYHYDSGGLVDGAVGVKATFTYPYLTRLDYDKFGQQALTQTGNGTRTQYTYNAENRRLTNLKANISQGYVFQNLDYGYDSVGNVTSIVNDTTAPTGPDVGMQVGGPSTQHFSYDNLYQLVHADGSYQPRTPQTDTYSVDLSYDSIHNLTNKNQVHQLISGGNTITENKLTYDYDYSYGGAQPHAATTVGLYTFQYDANGNEISRDQQPGPRRQMIWDEENRLACSHENTQSSDLPQTPASCDNAGGTPNDARYFYDDQGNRVVKDGAQFHVYPNQNFSTDGNKQFKHIYIANTKLLTKMVEPPQRIEDQQFYSHPDNLGSTGFVTDASGGLAEHIQYMPGGETWVSEHPSQPVPQQFTGKELDPETNLYYYGARYYDPRTQLWQTPDPILSSYLDGKPNGGVFNGANLALYTYAYNNPVRLVDPTGTDPAEDGGNPRLFAAVSDWIRDWIPGLLAAPLAGLVDIAGGIAQAVGGIASWNGKTIIGGLENMGLGALSMVGMKELFTDKWINPVEVGVHTTTLKMPRRMAKDIKEASDVQESLAPDAWKNGMHAWHAATNAHIVNRLGPVGAPFLWLAGLVHESPIDWGSFQSEQAAQGTVNHILDSSTDIVANTWGIILGLVLPRKIAVQAAAITGNYIPGPGDPDPAGLGTGGYTGRPWDAWGQYPGH